VHYLTPNETELLTLCQERAGADAGAGLSVEEAGVLARRLVGRGAAKVIVKLGARGALLVSAQGERLEPAPRVDAIDTTAAGDVLNAGFAVGLAEGLDEAAALRLGVTAASVSVTAEGAQTGMPSREAVAGRLGR
jgi:ribokinase